MRIIMDYEPLTLLKILNRRKTTQKVMTLRNKMCIVML